MEKIQLSPSIRKNERLFRTHLKGRLGGGGSKLGNSGKVIEPAPGKDIYALLCVGMLKKKFLYQRPLVLVPLDASTPLQYPIASSPI